LDDAIDVLRREPDVLLAQHHPSEEGVRRVCQGRHERRAGERVVDDDEGLPLVVVGKPVCDFVDALCPAQFDRRAPARLVVLSCDLSNTSRQVELMT